tara:strand:- start:148 stop:1686 length:1539 start_codon:yes stop_codon:yes gene_type:complete
MSFDIKEWANQKNKVDAKNYMISCGRELWDEMIEKNAPTRIGPKTLYNSFYAEVVHSMLNNSNVSFSYLGEPIGLVVSDDKKYEHKYTLTGAISVPAHTSWGRWKKDNWPMLTDLTEITDISSQYANLLNLSLDSISFLKPWSVDIKNYSKEITYINKMILIEDMLSDFGPYISFLNNWADEDETGDFYKLNSISKYFFLVAADYCIRGFNDPFGERIDLLGQLGIFTEIIERMRDSVWKGKKVTIFDDINCYFSCTPWLDEGNFYKTLIERQEISPIELRFANQEISPDHLLWLEQGDYIIFDEFLGLSGFINIQQRIMSELFLPYHFTYSFKPRGLVTKQYFTDDLDTHFVKNDDWEKIVNKFNKEIGILKANFFSNKEITEDTKKQGGWKGLGSNKNSIMEHFYDGEKFYQFKEYEDFAKETPLKNYFVEKKDKFNSKTIRKINKIVKEELSIKFLKEFFGEKFNIELLVSLNPETNALYYDEDDSLEYSEYYKDALIKKMMEWEEKNF